MSVGKYIYGTLTANAAVAAIISTKLYPHPAPEGTALPYATYQVISSTPTNTKSGVSTTDIQRVQINAFTTNYDDTVSLAEKIRTALDYVTGTSNTVTVSGCSYIGENELNDEDNVSTKGRALDFQIMVKR